MFIIFLAGVQELGCNYAAMKELGFYIFGDNCKPLTSKIVGVRTGPVDTSESLGIISLKTKSLFTQ